MALLATAGKNGNWRRALMYLDRQLEERRRAQRTRSCLRTLAASGDGREAQDSDSLRRLYNAAIQAVGRCGQWRVAVSMLYAMDAKHGLAPDAFSYGNAINACVQARRPRVARRLLADMRARGVPRNVVVYTMAMKALGDEPGSDARDVLLLLEEMERVTAAITVCALRADWQAAVALLRDMPLKYGVEPSEETWHAAIHACDRGMAWQQALTLLREMPVPTVTAYNSAMSACSR
ncbi:hypothetical protein JKP88DRAFT_266023 [Tribonema minus]|uniref:Pentacotripeptide-repeat region of PRORP domain-containing protein n=1 Tax=Tribonema minus TaxID=303371 RepID=A0A836C6H6_9STRA|nr:hypothetical protein JKP88DRAFT_266023 [Tribonema minus]